MSKSSDHRINKVMSIKKGKIHKELLKGLMKYETSSLDRTYILSKLSNSFTNIVYNNPLPDFDYKICQERASIANDDTTIINELFWNLETLIKYSKQINKFLVLEKQIENFYLLNKNDDCFDILNILDDEVCHSVFAINTEFLINELDNNSHENNNILQNISEEEIEAKLYITLQLDKLRIEKAFSSWQYDAIVEQEKLTYSKNPEYVDYIDFKYDPVFPNHDQKLSNIPFVLGFESDFSVIDRYKSTQKIISLILSQKELNEEDEKRFFIKIDELKSIFSDFYWQKLSLIGTNDCLEYNFGEEKVFYIIQDLFFEENYEQVKIICKETLESNPRCSEIYLFFIKSIIITCDDINKYLPLESQLRKILKSIKLILEKGKNYLQERQNLLDHFYQISHFKFSIPILEFLTYEYYFYTTNNVLYSSILNIDPIRYNFFNHFKTDKKTQSIKHQLIKFKTYAFLFDESELQLKEMSLFAKKIYLSKMLISEKYEQTLNLLNEFSTLENDKIEKFEFINTWLNKKYLNCYIELKRFSEFSELIVKSYFRNDYAYTHYFDEAIVEIILDSEDIDTNKNICIPILFEIYNQSQTILYDSIANFLIAHSLFIPSELIKSNLDFSHEQLIHFFEKVCTKENIEDSPFLNTIEAVENERILILNHLKILNPSKTEEYNEQILKITTESSIRLGLLHIHESRIYVDTLNIFKIVETHVLEIFERYLSLTDTNIVDITSIKLNEQYSRESSNLPYYFINPVDDDLLPFYKIANDPLKDSNVVIVPKMRFVYFTTIFNTIKNLFVFDESYGFKGYLSMRIRHGTFSNVLRGVFDKHHLVSQLESNSFEYKNVEYWNDKFDEIPNVNLLQVQDLLKSFSREIDRIIEVGLLWINVQSKENPSINAVFDFEYTSDEITYIFTNRVGRITDFNEFVNLIFDILYEKLEKNLSILQNKISNELTPELIKSLDKLIDDIQILSLPQNKKNLIRSNILSCRTDILIVNNEINNWFKISYNKSIEEFPLEMILKSSLKYIDIINSNAFTIGNVVIEDFTQSRFNGKYFESFGDIFINLFDNIISKNRDLGEDLNVYINIKEEENILTINVKNNISKSININDLSKSVEMIKKKITDYVDDSPIGFEKGSGYLKICKSIYIGLNQKIYSITPIFDENFFEVKIEFNMKDLIV
ncbi:hypothetical protein [Flavobacterium koreense]